MASEDRDKTEIRGPHILTSAPDSFSPDAFAARLRDIRKATGRTGADIAQHGNITKQTFSGYLHTGRLPSASVLGSWVLRLGINANWLLTGQGPMLLEQTLHSAVPVVERISRLVAELRETGADEAEVLHSLLAMLQEELARLENDDSQPSDLAARPALDSAASLGGAKA